MLMICLPIHLSSERMGEGLEVDGEMDKPKRKLSPHTLLENVLQALSSVSYNAGTRPTELCGRYNKEKGNY